METHCAGAVSGDVRAQWQDVGGGDEMTVDEAKTKTCPDKMIIVAGLGIGGKNRVFNSSR